MLLRTSCFHPGLVFKDMALCMDIWDGRRFWVTSQDWKEAANVRGAMVGINVSLVYDLQYEYRAKPLRGLLP